MTALLQVENLSFHVSTGHVVQKKKNILNDISFEVPRGAATAYLGANGAGKTSTFRILCGLAKASSGQVYFDGKKTKAGLPTQRFGFMPEQPYFYKNLTPYELLTGLGKLSGLRGNVLHKAIPEWAEKLEFSNVLQQQLSSCSKGQIQRVGLAQALIHQPDFILLDEPLSGLDPLGRECVRTVIHAEIQRGATVLFSSHILADAEAMCEYVIVLDEGNIAFSGHTKTLLQTETNWLIRAHWQGSDLPDFGSARVSYHIDGTLRIQGTIEQQRDDILKQILHAPAASLIAVEPERRTLEQAFVALLREKA
ncbi:MAG: ABC transporter ATP-binding protein [Mariprofundus sp.]|nr:ABC transporter ATP-binding protein [Mariprofundus sp.]